MDSPNDFKGLRGDAITLLEFFSFNVVSLIELSKYLIQWGSTAITLSIYSTILSIIRGNLRQGMSAQGLSLRPRRPSRDGVAPNDADRRGGMVHVWGTRALPRKTRKARFLKHRLFLAVWCGLGQPSSRASTQLLELPLLGWHSWQLVLRV